MRRVFVFLWVFLLLFRGVSADWDQLFQEDEDPVFYQHVNVISWQINLCFEDTVLQGPHPISLRRTYSSSGALERSRYSPDLTRKIIRGWLVQGGWSLFPHANLLVHFTEKVGGLDFKAFIRSIPIRSGSACIIVKEVS